MGSIGIMNSGKVNVVEYLEQLEQELRQWELSAYAELADNGFGKQIDWLYRDLQLGAPWQELFHLKLAGFRTRFC
jgi:hypothetical protein